MTPGNRKNEEDGIREIGEMLSRATNRKNDDPFDDLPKDAADIIKVLGDTAVKLIEFLMDKGFTARCPDGDVIDNPALTILFTTIRELDKFFKIHNLPTFSSLVLPEVPLSSLSSDDKSRLKEDDHGGTKR